MLFLRLLRARRYRSKLRREGLSNRHLTTRTRKKDISKIKAMTAMIAPPIAPTTTPVFTPVERTAAAAVALELGLGVGLEVVKTVFTT